MRQKLRVCIYCRVASEKSKDLLLQQETILKGFADNNNMEIVDVINEISEGKNFNSKPFQYLIKQIHNHSMDALLFYDSTRIAIFDHLYIEFELLAQENEIFLIPLKSLIDDMNT